MNLRDLEYICKVAELGHFGRAAESCHVSQSTLSIQIKKLEEYLGVQIFERTNKTVMPTAEGERIIKIAQSIQQEAAQIKSIAAHARNPLAGEFRLGIFPTLAPYLLPKLMPMFQAKLPQILPLIVEEKTATLLEHLRAGKIDAAILALPVDEAGLATAPLFEDVFLLACHKDHPLARKKTVSMQDLDTKSILLLEDGHCLRDQALEICFLSGAEEMKSLRATSMETLRQMVASNMGITLIPETAAIPMPNIVYRPFAGTPKPCRHIGLVWRQTSARGKLMDILVKLIKN